MISVFDLLQETTLPPQVWILIGLGGGLFLLIWFATSKSGGGSLNIKSKVVGDGQHGTARWASPKEISQTYTRVLFKVAEWRQGKRTAQNARADPWFNGEKGQSDGVDRQ